MKKFLSLMLCLALLLGLATTAYATGNTTTVSLEVPDETYTLKIPATVTIVDRAGSVTVAVEEVNLIWSTGLKVYMTAQNEISGENGSYLCNADSGNKIHYNFSKDVYGDLYGGNTIKYTALDTDMGDSNTIMLTVDGAYPGAGIYTDILTFTVNAYKTTG